MQTGNLPNTLSVSRVTDAIRAMEEAQKSAGYHLKQALLDLATPFLKDYPDIYGITWTQYAPYFNDGDPCTFRVNDLELVSGQSEEDLDEDSGGDSAWINGLSRVIASEWSSTIDKSAWKDKRLQTIGDIISDPGVRDVLENTLGSDVRVTITRDEVLMDEYDHE